jgi:hypothetical protein
MYLQRRSKKERVDSKDLNSEKWKCEKKLRSGALRVPECAVSLVGPVMQLQSEGTAFEDAGL